MQGGKMDFVAAGFNYRMTDFQAALVRGQFARIEEIIAYRNELAKISSIRANCPRTKAA